MDGRVLANAFAAPPKVATVDSWENVPGNDGTHPADYVAKEEDTGAEMQQLIDLGYVEDYGDDTEKAIAMTLAENKFILAKAYLDGQRWDEGTALLEELHAAYPDKLHYLSRLIHVYLRTGQLKKARTASETARAAFPHRGVQIELLEGTLLFAENKPKAALAQFERVKAEAGEFFGINLRIAEALAGMNEPERALAALDDHLAADPESERGYQLRGRILYRLREYEDALDALLTSVGLEYHNPSAHYYIGECLAEMGRYEEAVAAYEECLRYGPAFNRARSLIIRLLTEQLGQPGRARRYVEDRDANLLGTINIVSGLPRSGTSLVMQMLEAGGQDIFTDSERTADANNPRGYYEHGAVKNLAKNATFLGGATGRTVKVIANLLTHLPERYRYRVVFVKRDLGEVIRSQQKMLVRDAKRLPDDVLPLGLHARYEKTLAKSRAWLAQQANVDFLEVDYHDLVANPFEQSLLIHHFFGGELLPERMAAVPDPALYRERHAKTQVS